MPKKRKKPRRRLRRILLLIFLLLSALIALALTNLDYVANTELVTGLIKNKLKKKIRGRFKFSHITTDLIETAATIHDVHLWYEDGTKVLEAEAITFDIRLFSLLVKTDDITRIHAKNVKLHIWTDEDNVFLYKKIWIRYPGKKKLKHLARAISVENVDLVYEYRPTGYRIELEGLTGDCRIFDKRQIFVTAGMRKLHIISPKLDDIFTDISVEGVFDKEDYLEIYTLKALYENLPLDIRGRMVPLRPYRIMDFQLETAGDLPDALKALKYTGSSKGRFELSAHIDGPPDDFSVRGDMASPRGTFGRVAFEALKGAFEYFRKTVFTKDFSFKAFGMKFAGDLTYDLVNSNLDFDITVTLKGVSYKARGAGHYYRTRRVVRFSRLRISTPTLTLDATGEVNIGSSSLDMDIRLKTRNPGRDLRIFGLKDFKGYMEASGTIDGKYKNPHADMFFTFSNLGYGDLDLGEGEAEMELIDGVLIINRFASYVDSGELEARGTLKVLSGQGKPLGRRAMKLKFEVRAHNIDLKKRYPGKDMEGILNADLDFEGSIHGPKGTGKARIADFKFLTQKFVSASGPVLINQNYLEIDDWKLVINDDEMLEANARLFWDGRYAFDLKGTDLDLASMTVVEEKGLKLTGKFSLEASGQARLDHPVATGEIKFETLIYDEDDFAPVEFKFAVDNSIITIDGQGYRDMQVYGSYDLAKNSFIDMAFYFNNTSLDMLFNMLGREGEGHISGAIILNGGEKGFRDIEFGIALSKLDMTLSGLSMHNKGDIYIILGPRRTLIRPVHIEGDAGYIIIESPAQLGSNINASFIGEIQIKALRPFLKEIKSGDGKVFVAGNIIGPYIDPKIFGNISVEASSIRLASYKNEITGLVIEIKFDDKIIEIETAFGKARDGEFNASGVIHFGGEKAGFVHLKFTLTEMPIVSPGEYFISITADIELEGDKSGSILRSEEIFVNQGRYIKDVKFIGPVIEPGRETEIKAAFKSEFMKNMKLDLEIRDPGNFLIRNNLANMFLKTDLKVEGPLTGPYIEGKIEATGGKLYFQNISFEITSSSIDFPGGSTDADIEIQGETERRDWVITLRIEGKLSHMSLSLFATPELPHTDIVSLLVCNKTSEELNQGGAANAACVASLISKGWLKKVAKPLSDSTGIELSEFEAGSEGFKATIRLSKRIEAILGTTVGEEENVRKGGADIKLTDHIILSGTQDTLGVFKFQLKFHFAYE